MHEKLAHFLEPIRAFPFQLKHLTILFLVIIAFQIVVSLLHKTSVDRFLAGTQSWYQQDSAERLANLTATSLELMLETKGQEQLHNERDVARLVQGLNIILSQQILNQNVLRLAILVRDGDSVHAIDEGHALYAHLFHPRTGVHHSDSAYRSAIAMYYRIEQQLVETEEIHSLVEGRHVFHVFVPFVLRGEFVGVLYMENAPDFSSFTRSISSSYDETAITFTALILLGLVATFYISSYTIKARNTAQQLLFEQEKLHLAEQINHQKELLFTKRIYHTHHKAEKVMGFIKEDLRTLTQENMLEVKERVTKYSNFVARVIYDMKWYDPPVHTIRGSLFNTNLNALVRFLVKNVFQRVAVGSGQIQFVFDLDEQIPVVPVNEFVVWEVIEPIIQNALEHGKVRPLVVTIRTAVRGASTILEIDDNGVGIPPELLQVGQDGVKVIFHEHVSTKLIENQHSGYGCYIAYQIATQRCGWRCDVGNRPEGGCRFTFTIPHTIREGG